MASSAAQAQVAHLEREAQRVHLEAQRLNKAGEFEAARAKYDEMNRLEREALALAKAASECAACETETERQEALLRSPLEQARRWPAHSLARSAEDYARPLPFARFFALSQQAEEEENANANANANAARRRAAAAICGAYVADVASVGVQWIYDPAVLEELLVERRRGAADGGDDAAPTMGLEFLDPVRSPFLAADYRTGRPSPYGEETLVLVRELAANAEAGGLHCTRYAERYAAAFGANAFEGYMNASTRGFLRNFGASGLPPPWSGADDKQADCVARVAPLVAAFGGGGGDGDEGNATLGRAVEMATRTTQNDDEAVAWACAAALVLRRACLGERLEDAARGVVARLGEGGAGSGPMLRLPMSPERATAALGRNCHLPNSYQTPLQAALWGERVFESSSSTGGGRGSDADRERAFEAAIRGCLRGGGCCASRAQAAGALLAARLGKEAIPLAWRAKCWDWAEVEEAAGKIAGC